MGAYVDIFAGELGSSVRMKLNSLGNDSEIAFHIVSELSEIINELNYFATSSVVFAISEKKWYEYNGAAWVESDIFNYVNMAEIDDTDSPYSPLAEKTIICDTSGGNIIINLPDPSTVLGKEIKIRNYGSGTVTLNATSIEGSTSFVMMADESVVITATSLGWLVI